MVRPVAVCGAADDGGGRDWRTTAEEAKPQRDKTGRGPLARATKNIPNQYYSIFIDTYRLCDCYVFNVLTCIICGTDTRQQWQVPHVVML